MMLPPYFAATINDAMPCDSKIVQTVARDQRRVRWLGYPFPTCQDDWIIGDGLTTEQRGARVEV